MKSNIQDILIPHNVVKPDLYEIPTEGVCYISPLTSISHSLNDGVHQNIKPGDPILFTNGSDNEVVAICPFYRPRWINCHDKTAYAVVPGSIYVAAIGIYRMIRYVNNIIASGKLYD
ncbi:MAG: hypothetical protein DRQ48_10220 [Gammaproteobacteria bacterium]|nr:MAG: hypothetical protein DRQ48_10220 [Gammaproteobacteria bacterium]